MPYEHYIGPIIIGSLVGFFVGRGLVCLLVH